LTSCSTKRDSECEKHRSASYPACSYHSKRSCSNWSCVDGPDCG